MDHLTKMYTVRKNCAQMLQDRGYMVHEVGSQGHTCFYQLLQNLSNSQSCAHAVDSGNSAWQP